MTDNQDTSNLQLPDKLVDDDARASLTEHFASLKRKVELHVYTEPDAKDIYSRFVRKISDELAAIDSKISVVAHKGSEAPDEVSALPQLAIKAEGAAAPILTMVGAPIGEEGRVLIQAVMFAGTDENPLTKEAKETLAKLNEKRVIKVFGSGSCPYCPGQMSIAAAFAKERPDLVTAYAIAAEQVPGLSKHYNVGGVPHSVVNETHAVVGLMPDAPFAAFVAELKNEALGQYAENAVAAATSAGGYQPGADDLFGAQPAPAELKMDSAAHSFSQKAEKGDEFNPRLLILGGGPAGLSAAVYGARAGLSVTVLDSGMLGGQVSLTPYIENYPGSKQIKGSDLAANFIAHADEYANLRGNMQITNLEHKDGKFIAHTSNGLYSADAIIFATGASWRSLGVPGEAVYSGRGVHNCASCDGYIYVGKKVHIIGGGNTALTDALHLANLGIDVSIVHRRDKFRGEDALVRACSNNPRIRIVWDSTVKEIVGDGEKVTGIRLVNVHSGEESLEPTDGVFVSVGQNPNSRPAMVIKAELTPSRHIKVDDKMRTTVPHAYAAGDVTGGFQQVVMATAAGAMAANTAFEDLQH